MTTETIMKVTVVMGYAKFNLAGHALQFRMLFQSAFQERFLADSVEIQSSRPMNNAMTEPSVQETDAARTVELKKGGFAKALLPSVSELLAAAAMGSLSTLKSAMMAMHSPTTDAMNSAKWSLAGSALLALVLPLMAPLSVSMTGFAAMRSSIHSLKNVMMEVLPEQMAA